MLKLSTSLVLVFVYCSNFLTAQPHPGDLFREYIWLPSMVKEKGKFLRVGGKLDYQISEDHMPIDAHDDGHIPLQDSLILQHATKAEVTFEMVQSHDDTKGLAIQINKGDWYKVPKMSFIPDPQSSYMSHTYPSLEIPIEALRDGGDNVFRLKVDSTQRWNWPQHIFYGIIFRVYYDQDAFNLPEIKIGEIPEKQIRSAVVLTLETNQAPGIEKVEFIGEYSDFDWEGNGKYHQWHGHTHRGLFRNHIGTSDRLPFHFTWDTEWLPNQRDKISVAARVHFRNGLIKMTESLSELTLDRPYSIELCRPYQIPKNWVTRQDTFQAKFDIHGDLTNALQYQAAWRSWSPCYGRGIFINGQKIWDKEDPCYGYAEHTLTFDSTNHLQQGENVIATGMTPLIDGKMVHGMEVQYPGIMVKVKYRPKISEAVHIIEGKYENRDHFIINTRSATYYYDIAGGGLSRMIDREGRDWISFKMEPWGEYPAAAASAFRGMPNFVFGSEDNGAGHPGHDMCISKLVDDNSILTESKSSKWAWQWRFFDDYAQVEILRHDEDHPYWFLYEGTPGGEFAPSKQYFGTSAHRAPDHKSWDYYSGDKYFAQIAWAYFGHDDFDRLLFVRQERGDQKSDTFSYLGNTESGIQSDDGMVVFGFGRADGAKPQLMNPTRFSLGFIEKKVMDAQGHEEIRKLIENH